MYGPIPDLSVYRPDRFLQLDMDILTVGWLDPRVSYNTGSVPEVFVDRLKLFCINPVLAFFEKNNCPLCLEYPKISTLHGDLDLGSCELRIPGQNKIVYASPDMICHYIISHNYKPPQEFIDAVLNAPLPDTIKYKEFAKQWNK